MKSILLIVLVFVLISLSLASLAQAVKINVVESVWTDAVDSYGNYSTKFSTSAPTGPLLFWVKVSCNTEAARILLTTGQLPIRFKWFQKVGGSWMPKGITHPYDSVTTLNPVNDSTHVHNLIWKSWSGKSGEELKKGKWRVSVKLMNDNLVTESTIKIQ